MKIDSRADIANALRASIEQGGLMLEEADLGAPFFDPDSGLVRELAQKFTSYRARLAVIVPDPLRHGAGFAEQVQEYRAHTVVRFFASVQLARQWLAQLPNKKC